MGDARSLQLIAVTPSKTAALCQSFTVPPVISAKEGKMIRIFARQQEGWAWELWGEFKSASQAWREMLSLRLIGYHAVKFERV